MVKLTEKEEEVMEWIWKIGPCSPKDVVARFDEPRPHVNTVATMFQFLERKGYLRHEAVGRGYVYHPTIEKENYGSQKIGRIVDSLFGKSYMNVVSTLVREEKVSQEELVAFLEELKKNNQVS